MMFYSLIVTCVVAYDAIIVQSAYMSYPSLLDPCRTVWFGQRLMRISCLSWTFSTSNFSIQVNIAYSWQSHCPMWICIYTRLYIDFVCNLLTQIIKFTFGVHTLVWTFLLAFCHHFYVFNYNILTKSMMRKKHCKILTDNVLTMYFFLEEISRKNRIVSNNPLIVNSVGTHLNCTNWSQTMNEHH